MPEKHSKPTRKELDFAIDGLIKEFKEGKRQVSREYGKVFMNALYEVSRKKFKGKSEFQRFSWMNDFMTRSMSSPQFFLLNCAELGLIKKKGQLNFVSKMKIVLEIENSLMNLRHANPFKFSEFIEPHLNKPFEERVAEIKKISSLDFKGLFLLKNEYTLLRNKINNMSSSDKKKKLQKQLNSLNRQIKNKEDNLVYRAKMGLSQKFYSPDSFSRLKLSLKPNKNLSKRELEVLQQAYDNLHSNRVNKMKRKLRIK